MTIPTHAGIRKGLRDLLPWDDILRLAELGEEHDEAGDPEANRRACATLASFIRYLEGNT